VCLGELKLVSFSPQVLTAQAMAASDAKMDLANRALCFAYRHPPPGQKKVPYEVIAALMIFLGFCLALVE